jgi:hypothetical protein
MTNPVTAVALEGGQPMIAPLTSAAAVREPRA